METVTILKTFHFSFVFIETKQGIHSVLIGGVVGAGGFGLVALVALAVLLVKYRRTQQFPNSNKADEPAGQNNAAYMPEDDVIEKEGTD